MSTITLARNDSDDLDATGPLTDRAQPGPQPEPVLVSVGASSDTAAARRGAA